MKLLVVIAVCVVITAAVPIDSNSTEEQQNDLNSVNEDSNAESADRSKRFIFFKWFYPYPVYAAPVKVVKYVEPAPVVYKVSPVTYTYSVAVPRVTVVSKPVVAVKTVPLASTTITKTVSSTVEADEVAVSADVDE